MDWLGPALEQYGLVGALALLFALALWRIVRSNADVNKTSGEHIQQALTLVGDSQNTMREVLVSISETLSAIKGNTAAVEAAVLKSVEDNHNHLDAVTNTLSSALSSAADNATIERAAQNQRIDEHFESVISKLDDLTGLINGSVTADDWQQFSMDMREMFTDIKKEIREIRAACVRNPNAQAGVQDEV